uniref:Single-strand selective monofunctional uracil DNA glycosylase n=1 Tax=Rhipicephalus zambeziensis TaxID=60191 RepID=A0A224YZ97_9ACAR
MTCNDAAADEIADAFLAIEQNQSELLSRIPYGSKVSHVYNPLEYARETHECFVRKYCRTRKEVLFLGMNPGPFGMAQNGVPFGDTAHVVGWLGIQGHVAKPKHEHPRRPVLGLGCTRSEAICDAALLSVLELLRPEAVVGIGCYARDRALSALSASSFEPPRVLCLTHPSPASPKANRGWHALALSELLSFGLISASVADKASAELCPTSKLSSKTVAT